MQTLQHIMIKATAQGGQNKSHGSMRIQWALSNFFMKVRARAKGSLGLPLLFSSRRPKDEEEVLYIPLLEGGA